MLDYGVLDADNPQVTILKALPYCAACPQKLEGCKSCYMRTYCFLCLACLLRYCVFRALAAQAVMHPHQASVQTVPPACGCRSHDTVCFFMQAGFLLPLSIPDGDTCYDDKADIAELNGLQETTDFVLYPDKPPTIELTAFLRLINISGQWYNLHL